ncbi:MAG TPA: TrkH family potassium uptake protein [Acidobacteriota bacterium]|nr:TrkH family potassium uptake protein [Acidobacteriota bacterium]
MIARFVGLLLLVEAVFMATSLAWTIADGEAIAGFVISAGLTAVAGVALRGFGRQSQEYITPREAIATVGLGWVLVGVFGALPYLFEGAFSHPADALFESISGFTTTGASALRDIEGLPRGLLWWRSLTQWLGGMGIIVLFIAIFPRLGLGAGYLFKSEVPGPITERLRPKLRHTSLILWYVYLGITAALAVALFICGVSPFASACHAFTTMATGGYSTLNSSIGGYGSVAVEMVVMFFMFLAGVNFSLYYRLVQGDTRTVWRDRELRTYIIIMGLATLLVTVAILPSKAGLGEALRYGSFHVVSLQTTTGFGTDDFDTYPHFARLLLVGLMFVGGSAGSTAGGIKIARFLVLGRALANQLYKSFHPRAVLAVRIGATPVESDTVRAVCIFFATFIGLFFLGALLLTLFGIDLVTAGTASIACLANIGPGLALVGPTQNYAFVPGVGKIILSILMILGRLEILTILALLVPSFWRR